MALFQFLHLSLPPHVAIVGAYGGTFKVHIISSKVRKRILLIHCNHGTTKYHNKRWPCHVHTDYQHGICLFQSAIHFAFFTSSQCRNNHKINKYKIHKMQSKLAFSSSGLWQSRSDQTQSSKPTSSFPKLVSIELGGSICNICMERYHEKSSGKPKHER